VTVGRAELAKLTAGKAVNTTSFRWLPFFLPVLAAAFMTSTSTLTTILGLGEMAGLTTLVVGRHLDGGRERQIMAGALALSASMSLVAVTANLWLFAGSFVLLMVGAATYTVAGHTYLSRRVAFAQRARTIGIFEVSWASALLVGVPIIALLISAFGWRAPFIVLSILGLMMAVVVARSTDSTPLLADAASATDESRLSVDAWILIAAGVAISVAGLTTIVIAGTWLSEAFGVSTAGIGLVAVAFGLAELAGSVSSAAIADRVGPVAGARYALVVTVVGLLVMSQAGTSLVLGVIGLLGFFLGFEFAIVTSFSFVSEAMPAARGRVLATNNAFGTLGRGAGVISSGPLYETFGIGGPVALSVIATIVALTFMTVSINRTS